MQDAQGFDGYFPDLGLRLDNKDGSLNLLDEEKPLRVVNLYPGFNLCTLGLFCLFSHVCIFS